MTKRPAPRFEDLTPGEREALAQYLIRPSRLTRILASAAAKLEASSIAEAAEMWASHPYRYHLSLWDLVDDLRHECRAWSRQRGQKISGHHLSRKA